MPPEDAESAKCYICAAPLDQGRCPVCAGDPANLPSGFKLRCLKCDYDLQGNESGFCPECGASASTWRLVRHYEKLEAARSARATKARELAQTVLGIAVVILAAVPTMPLGWPFTVAQVGVVCIAAAVWWKRGRRHPEFEPEHCLVLLLVPTGVTYLFTMLTLGHLAARWPVVCLISLTPGVAAAVVGLIHRPVKTVAITTGAIAFPLLVVGAVCLSAGLSAANEGTRYTGFERPWDRDRRPTFMTTAETYRVAAITLPPGLVLAGVSGACAIWLRRSGRSAPPGLRDP